MKGLMPTPDRGSKPNPSVQQKSCRGNQIFFAYIHRPFFPEHPHMHCDGWLPPPSRVQVCRETRWGNHRRKRPGAWRRRGTYWKLGPPSTSTLGSWTIYLHPCIPAPSFSESIMKRCLPSNILLSLQPCRKEHHCLHYHPEDPVPTLQVSQCLGFGNGQILDEILEFTLEKWCISAGTRKLSSGATTIIP